MAMTREVHLGPIYRIHRKQRKLSIAQVSDTTGIPTSSISEFENKKKEFSIGEIIKLYTAIGIKYKNQVQHRDEILLIFKTLYTSIYLMEFENSETLKKIATIEEDVQCTTTFPVYVLSYFLYYVYHQDKFIEYEKIISFLNTYIAYLSDSERQIYADTLGYHYRNIYSYDKALYEFNYAIQHNVCVPCYAMANYHKAMILNNNGCISESLACIKKAKKIFDRDVNVRRSISASMLMAMSYARQDKFAQAQDLNKQCLYAMRLVSMNDEILWTYNNIMWNYILSEEYEQVKPYGKEALKLNDKKASYYFFMAFAEYKLEKIENAKEWIKTAKQYREEATLYMKLIINAFYTFLSDKANLTKKRNKLILAYEEAVEIKDYQLQIFVLKLIMELDLLENNKDYEIKHLKMINNLYKNRK